MFFKSPGEKLSSPQKKQAAFLKYFKDCVKDIEPVIMSERKKDERKMKKGSEWKI